MTIVETIAQPLMDELHRRLAAGQAPVFVALDGRSGVGKSTVAAFVADECGVDADGQRIVTVIEGDHFYRGGSSATWDRRTTEQKVAGVIDWLRQRTVLASLRSEGRASWHDFDWDADNWDADPAPWRLDARSCTVSAVVVLEGAYSARPELADLIDLRVLLTRPADVRRAQLEAREGQEYRADWEARWSAAEAHYFDAIVPPGGFDLIIGDTSSPGS